MFVCLGNICRSPLAEAVFRDLLLTENKSKHYLVASSGTGGWHIGADCDPRTRLTAEKNKISITHKAKQFSLQDGENFDIILAMDQTNYQDIKNLLPTFLHKKVFLFRSFDLEADSQNVPDPYYGGPDGFDRVFDMVKKTCYLIYKKLEEND